jgi:hypothetical protein
LRPAPRRAIVIALDPLGLNEDCQQRSGIIQTLLTISAGRNGSVLEVRAENNSKEKEHGI